MALFLILTAILAFLSIWVIPIRLTLFHPVLTARYAVTDIYHYFKYHKWHNFKMGKFNCYDATLGCVFGSGKTLSALWQVRRDYKKYNDKLVFDVHRFKWVTQKVHILTNLSLKSLPYEKLVNLGQIINSCERYRDMDLQNDTLTCIVVLIDEAQNQLHCRSFKDNLSPMMLKALTECRHYNMSIYYDCPRFSQVDALLRQCTSLNIKNHKIWRWQCQQVYDAQDIENSNNVNNVKPLKRAGFFIENDIFAEYDTKEIIDNLVKAKDRGDLMSDDEILQLQMNTPTDLNNVLHLSKQGSSRLG